MEKREEILDAAMRVFEDGGGIAAVSFRNVAKQLGCSYSAPYRYFSGKDELITALRARAYRWMEAELSAVVHARDPASQQLERVAQAYIQAGVSRPSVYALMFFELEGSDLGERSLELKAAKRAALGVCVDVIAVGQEAGTLPVDADPLTAAHMFWIGAHGLVSLHVGGQFVMGRSTRALVPTLIRWLSAGLQHATADTRHGSRSEVARSQRRQKAKVRGG